MNSTFSFTRRAVGLVALSLAAFSPTLHAQEKPPLRARACCRTSHSIWRAALCFGFAACTLSVPAWAQSYPNKPIKFVTNFPAGGPADFLAIAGAVRVLILEDIPQLSSANYNEAKRFVTLIDALYEGRVRLICSAAEAPERLYIEGEGSFEFARTASRLREMQAADWAVSGA